MLIGCIADDPTGATDLAVTLAREGLSVTPGERPAADHRLPRDARQSPAARPLLQAAK